MNERPILALEGIHKRFGGIQALANVSFDLREGEVHALVGENGAGKSTLIKTITGAYRPDDGVIKINGSVYHGLTPQEARQLGVGVVYQEFNLLPDMSAAENIFLSRQPRGRFGLIDHAKRTQQAHELLERLGATHVDADALCRDLTVGEQQIIEIAKALTTDARILIMDEPTAVLPARDVERLFTVIRNLRDEGHGIIYISHRLEEIFTVADRVTVLKDGVTQATKDVAKTREAELVRLMVGRELVDMYPDNDIEPGNVVLQVRALSIERVVFDVNFEVREGEIVGLAGLGGSGRTTICRALVGLADIDSGEIRFLNDTITPTPNWARRAGVALIPEDRKGHGLILDQCVRFNITLPNLRKFEKWSVIRRQDEKEPVMAAIKNLDIRPPQPELEAGSLSGGNQQKVVLAKWLMAEPRLLIFDEPTRGVDVGAKAEIYKRM
ncbi:MAG: sugar ABC transporter ATP-binding protein, partial [Chloroflexota bacterium]